MDPVLIFRGLVALLGLGGMIVSYQLAAAVARDGKTAMVQFQLQPDRTIRQFEIMLGFIVAALIALAVYLLGAVLAHETILLIGRALVLGAALPIVYVFFEWWQVIR